MFIAMNRFQVKLGNEAEFERIWRTKSDAFRKAHQNAGQHRDLYLGGPNFEGFDVIQTVK